MVGELALVAPDALCEGAGVVVVVLERRVGSAPCDLVGRAAIPVEGVPVAARVEPSVDQPVPSESGRLSGLSGRLSSRLCSSLLGRCSGDSRCFGLCALLVVLPCLLLALQVVIK